MVAISLEQRVKVRIHVDEQAWYPQRDSERSLAWPYGTHLPDPGRPTTCTRPTRCTLPTRLYATLMQFLKYLQRACRGRWICTRREMTVKRARIERIHLKLFGYRRDGDAERSEGECMDCKTRLVYWNKWNLVACLSKVTVEGWTLKFGKY